jgi:AraC-like DNA-binding protein/cbb3-type cytochrome oxidase subunit 3
MHKARFFWISGLLVLAIVSLLAILYFYRKRQRAYRGLYRQIKEQDRLSEELGRMTKLSENLLSSVPQSVGAEAEKLLPGDRQQRELVARLHEYLLRHENFAKSDINHNELALELATNKTYLFEAVKAVTGKTPMEYINEMRLQEAKQKLENSPEFTVETIASDCGFNSRRTFYRLFKELYGVNPAEYRKTGQTAKFP